MRAGEQHGDNDAALNSDDFRMFAYKVLPCPKRTAHEWTTCAYAHPGEKARRRDPRVYNYLAIPCDSTKNGGTCPRGDDCPNCHSLFEYWLHPSRYRTQLCRNHDGTHCKRQICFFAHSIEELRVPDYSHLHIPEEMQKRSTTPASSGSSASSPKAASSAATSPGPSNSSSSSSSSTARTSSSSGGSTSPASGSSSKREAGGRARTASRPGDAGSSSSSSNNLAGAGGLVTHASASYGFGQHVVGTMQGGGAQGQWGQAASGMAAAAASSYPALSAAILMEQGRLLGALQQQQQQRQQRALLSQLSLGSMTPGGASSQGVMMTAVMQQQQQLQLPAASQAASAWPLNIPSGGYGAACNRGGAAYTTGMQQLSPACTAGSIGSMGSIETYPGASAASLGACEYMGQQGHSLQSSTSGLLASELSEVPAGATSMSSWGPSSNSLLRSMSGPEAQAPANNLPAASASLCFHSADAGMQQSYGQAGLPEMTLASLLAAGGAGGGAGAGTTYGAGQINRGSPLPTSMPYAAGLAAPGGSNAASLTDMIAAATAALQQHQQQQQRRQEQLNSIASLVNSLNPGGQAGGGSEAVSDVLSYLMQQLQCHQAPIMA